MTHLSIDAASLAGLVRDHNEDAILIDTDIYRDAYAQREADIDVADTLIMAVADGLGGHNAGEVASEDAARELATHIAAMPAVLSADELRADLAQWARDEHAYLKQQGNLHPSQEGMATTLTAVLLHRSRVYAINCGDSRTYLFSSNGLQQLTRDHSLYELTHNLSDKHIITNCIGTGDEPFIDFDDITDRLCPGAKLLLCSDGLSDLLSDADIRQLCAEGADAHAFVDAVYAKGARDNVSVIIATIA